MKKDILEIGTGIKLERWMETVWIPDVFQADADQLKAPSVLDRMWGKLNIMFTLDVK